jgi:4-hydroxy-tetrahydrodipicolinate reductase
MNIAIIGYGKMGRAIEEIAKKRGHVVTLAISRSNANELTPSNLAKADVAIEFTGPEAAFENVTKCLQAGIPVVCGSTGWVTQLDRAREMARENNTGFIYASNFSVGVNVFFEINQRLATLMARRSEYEVIIEETHHTQKKDAPSGTAITLAEQVIAQHPVKKKWVNELSERPEDLEIISQRIDPAPGTHLVRYSSAIDTIEITHTAHSRMGFAAGAVLAAEFLNGKSGVFTMRDVLQL